MTSFRLNIMQINRCLPQLLAVITCALFRRPVSCSFCGGEMKGRARTCSEKRLGRIGARAGTIGTMQRTDITQHFRSESCRLL